jgi:hypothetical protein
VSSDKKISYIIASRNDSYGGDSLGRLEKTLNHTGYILGRSGFLEKSEVIITDWGTPKNYRPLRDSLNLNDEIKSILKIIEVPLRIANRYQLNSPFSEVHAMNAAFRRSSGAFFGRIDQDTLIGDRFVDWFYRHFHEDYTLNVDWPLVAFSGRRNLDPEQSKSPYQFIFDKKRYKEVKICHSNNFYSRIHPNKQSMMLFYGGAVGILLIHRDLYKKHKGYNENFIYMNNMETEFLNRLKSRNDFYNLGLKSDGDFYHLHHSRKDGAKEDSQLHAKESGSRKTNPPLMREAEPFNPNSDNWGLKNEQLNIFTFENL